MKKYLCLFLLLFALKPAPAQVTTNSLTGTIRNSKGELLAGALIKAIYNPTGSVYIALSGADGKFTLPNLRNGGPYRIIVTLKRYRTFSTGGIELDFGYPLKMDIVLKGNSKLLAEALAPGSEESMVPPENTGPSTYITPREIRHFPASNNSYQDFALFTPQATPLRGSADNNPLDLSYAGQSNKYNLFTIDGAKGINVYGLYLNAPNINPLPFASIWSLQVLLSPYDVIYGRFLGADINAISNSGTNQLRGSAYSLLQDQKSIGTSVTTGLKYPNFINKVFGASLGGPIISNKLFFFVNIENRQALTPLPYDPTQSGSGSKFSASDLQGLQNYVKNTYGFDIGGYAGINKTANSTSAFGRIDWDIDSKNKLTFRNSYFGGDNFDITRTPTNLVFDNSAYTIKTRTNSMVLELNSSLSAHSSNVFRLNYNYINNARNTPAFPSIDISQGGLIYNLGGNDLSDANSLAQKDFNIVDYFSLYKGRHTFTFGTDNEFYALRNVFLQNFYGYYTYRSVAAFEANATPASYSVGYSTKGGADQAPDVMRAAELSIFSQDVWEVNNQLRLTYGLRLDKPLFLNKPGNNTDFNSSSIAAVYGIATNKTPRSNALLSPRIGFNYDVYGDLTTQLRVGAGIFTGDMPYIWLSNQYANNGINSIIFTGVPAGLTLQYNPNQPHLGAYIPPNSAAAPTEIDVTDPNFKLPRQLHANLAIDHTLPWGMVGTLEALYSKKISDILYRNLNIAPVENTVSIGNTTRPFYNYAYVNKNYSDVIELTNTNIGYAYDFTAQLKKQFIGGWSAMAAYTFGHSYSVNDVMGSSSLSNWRTDYAVNGLNNPVESNSSYDPGSRVIAYFSKIFTYKRLTTNILLVYSGQTGQRYSYLYNYNITGDGNTTRFVASDLVYIPTDASQFVAFNRNVNGVSSTVSPAQQLADLQAFIADNADLQKFEGKNTARNAFSMPWENHVDLKITESITTLKNQRLQFGINFINVGNLIIKTWGRAYYLANQEFNLFNVVSAGDDPRFTFDNTRLNTVNGRLRPYAIDDYYSRWSAQVNLGYKF